jgi:hypothetical protein
MVGGRCEARRETDQLLDRHLPERSCGRIGVNENGVFATVMA